MMNSNSGPSQGPRPLQRVTEILEHRPFKGVIARVHPTAVAGGVRSFLADFRLQLRQRAHPIAISPASELAARVAGHLLGDGPSPLRPVINATGILIHNELGRTPLADKAIERVAAIARDYANVDLDLRTGERTFRHGAVSGLLKQITGAEAAVVANNNAAAMLLALAALAAGREVIVSRGELLELEAGLRVPDLITASGARLREVGTANRTLVSDYRDAIGEPPAAILRIESGDTRTASTARPSLAELVELAQSQSIPLVQNVGSGGWANLPGMILPSEVDVTDSLQQGVDLVLSCGDKGLGGPQCGIMLGKETVVNQLLKHPLMRAVRVDRLTLAALAATLELARDEAMASRELPLVQLLGTPLENLRQRAERIASQVVPGGAIAAAEARESTACLTGARADERVPSWCVSLTPRGLEASQLAARLRHGMPAVVGRVELSRLDLDLRAVFPRQDAELVAAIGRAP